MQDKPLSRLHPFEGLCLTSQDLLDEQTYHRRSLQLHNRHLHGYGILVMEIHQLYRIQRIHIQVKVYTMCL